MAPPQKPYWTPFRLVAMVIAVIIILWLLFSIFVIVPAGHRGVLLTFGKVEDKVLGEGLHVIAPVVNSVQLMEVRTLKYETDATAATKDLLDVHTKLAVNYHIQPEVSNVIYQEIGRDYQGRIIAPAVQEVVKSITAKFNAEELITHRSDVKQQIDATLIERLQSRDIIVETVSLTDFQFPTKFNEAIVDKQTAVQLKLKAENDLGRIKVEAEQQIAKSKGEAESIRIINEQLQKSPQYLQFIATQKWNGVLPLATGATVPFIQIPTGS